MTNEGSSTKVYCDQCGGERNHEILKEHIHTETDEHMWVKSRHMIVSCKGCDTIRFYKEQQCSADAEYDHYQEDMVLRTIKSIHPVPRKKTARHWQQIVYLDKSGDLYFLIEEMYVAYNLGQVRLTAMAIRAVVDTIISIMLKDSVSPFNVRLQRYHEEGHIGKNDLETLAVVIEVGHAATHRNWTPEMEVIECALVVLENILQKICHRDEVLLAARRIPPKQKNLTPENA